MVACNEKEQDDVSPSAVKKALHQERMCREEGFQSGRELIPRLKSGALEIDHEQLADSG